jgi:hypothetical protein
MENVTASKAEVLKALRANRDAHRGIFEEAVAGYRDEVTRQLEDFLDRIKSGQRMRIYLDLPEPLDHTKDYDRAIKMIELSVNDTIELSEMDVKQYVMDDWVWKQQFLASNSSYSATAATQLHGQ